ncbi:MAG: DNA-directed RNA polymerase subunit B'' [Nanoarchaeota archaeon]|nr:DNA-directed RNA polymerase subunit B'' [Nanoarchaeota archaeon]
MNQNTEIIKKYYETNSVVASDLASFNNFIEVELQKIISEVGDIIPTVIPSDMDDFRIKFNKIWVDKPEVTEADGSKRDIFPTEARLRKLTYAGPINLEVSAHIDGVQRESFTTQIGKLPIMLQSKYCHLNKLSKEDLIKKGEDSDDVGGYFILNGNERVLITVEDLVSNRMFVEKITTGPTKFSARIFSEKGSYRVPHLIEQTKDGIINLSFTRLKKVPIISVIKALGMIKDAEIMQHIDLEEMHDDIFVNLYNTTNLKTQDEALEFVGKKMGINQPPEIRGEKTMENLDKYLLPHLGLEKEDRKNKAVNLCKIIKRFLLITKKDLNSQDIDHYMHKRLKLSGDLMGDLFKVHLRSLINDIMYNFQRLVKRTKYTSLSIIIRDKLLTSRINSAMATGVWVGGRKGLSQNLDRTNYLSSLSHLQRVNSLLSATQENFAARALHATHWGRLCAIETPEGTSIGLRKNLALMADISSEDVSNSKIIKSMKGLGLISE